MKKILLCAAVLAVATLSSCTKEDAKSTEPVAKTTLALKISCDESTTRAIEGAVADKTTADLNDGWVFVVDPLNSVTSSVELSVADATSSTGQILADIPTDSRIYVVGNIASEKAAISKLTTLTALKEHSIKVSTQDDITSPILANTSTEPEQIVVDDATGNASVSVPIQPLIARVELSKVSSDATVKSFTVAGVYLDDYYTNFGLKGDPIGSMYEQKTSTDFSTVLHKDENTVAATGTPLTAKNDEDKVWAHNVTPNSLPRYIIKLTNVKYVDDDGNTVDCSSTPMYLTVSGYTDVNSSAITALNSGNVYSVGGTDGITFTKDDLSLTPNPDDVTLYLKVTVDPWKLVTTGVSLK